MISIPKKTKIWLLPLISIILISSAVFVYARLHTVSYLDTRTVGNLTVLEFRESGTEELLGLAEDNSHRVLSKSYTGNDNGGWTGLTVDIDNFDFLNPDPEDAIVHQTDFGSLAMSSRYQTDGSSIVWDEKHDFAGPTSRFDKIMLYNLTTQSTTSVSSNPYPSTASVHTPWVSGNYVVYSKKESANSNLHVYLYNATTYATTRISPINSAASDAKIYGNYIVWLDWRNENTTGIDIYGYNINTHQYFTVSSASGDQYTFCMNNRYVLYKGGDNNNNNHQGLFLYDLTNGVTSTISPNDINQAFMSSGSTANNTYICWDEPVTNANGTFWAVKFKKISDSITSSVTDTSTLDYDQVPSTINSSYVGWCKGFQKNSTGVPFLYKMLDQTNTQIDENGSNCFGISMDDTWVMWSRVRDFGSSDSEEINICGCALP